MTDLFRRITDPAELQAIYHAGVGYIFSPFNRTAHHASCTRAGTAATSTQPKIFTPSPASAVAYQRDRLLVPTAQPYRIASCCSDRMGASLIVTRESDAGAARPPTAPTPYNLSTRATYAERAVSDERDWLLPGGYAETGIVELWATRRLGLARDSEQEKMVRRVTAAVQALGIGTIDQRISGLFVSDDTTGNQPDAENITFYNFGDAPFRSAPPTLAFERSCAAPPPSPEPLRRRPRYYHRWWLDGVDAPWTTWSAIGEPVAEWTDISLQVPEKIQDLGLHAWLAVRDAPSGCVTVRESLGKDDYYAAVIGWAVPDPDANVATAVKGLVDGPLAALQRADHLSEPVIDRLLQRRWPVPMTRDRLLSLVRAYVPPPVLPGAPFNRNGLNPYDKRCVAGRVEIRRSADASATLWGHIVRVALRSRAAHR